eukprot:760254-Hanusia_phi.AAC.3
MEDYTVSITQIFDIIKKFENGLKQPSESGNSVSFLVIVDACRSTEELKVAERLIPQHPVVDVLPRSWCLCFTCSNGEKAKDESEFFQQMLNEQEGMFALNKSLQHVVLDCARRSKRDSQSAVPINAQDVPEFCLVEDEESCRESIKIQGAMARVSQELTPSTALDDVSNQADIAVAAYSPAQVRDFREHVKALLRDFLSNTHLEEPSWRLCSLFLLAFLRDKETVFSSKSVLEYYRSMTADIGPELIDDVNKMLAEGEITSAKFQEWRTRKMLDIPSEKLCVAVLHFTVTEEIRKIIENEREAGVKIKLWERRGLGEGSSYTESVSWQEALNRMERYFKNDLIYEGGTNILFAGYVLKKAIETGSYVLVLRMTEMQSICFFRFLLESGWRSGSGKEADGQEKEEKIHFTTFISSSGWWIRYNECKTDWRSTKDSWVEGLKQSFTELVQFLPGGGSNFERWQDILQEGDGEWKVSDGKEGDKSVSLSRAEKCTREGGQLVVACDLRCCQSKGSAKEPRTHYGKTRAQKEWDRLLESRQVVEHDVISYSSKKRRVTTTMCKPVPRPLQMPDYIIIRPGSPITQEDLDQIE